MSKVRAGDRNRTTGRKKAWIITGLLFVVMLCITGSSLNKLCSECMIRELETGAINYDTFRELKLNNRIIVEARQRIEQLCRRKPELQGQDNIDVVGYLTFCMLARGFDLSEKGLVSTEVFRYGIGRISQKQGYQKLYQYYRAIISDLECFPVPRVESKNVSSGKDISFVDTWSDLRNYGGKRRHEGTDIMAKNNIRGYYPVVSITDGTVEKLGWLEQGGYRVGIRSPSGGYFYYAHLSTYAPELNTGDTVIAGQLLGFMGDSGYGKEGTIGKFDVHLHLGIYVTTDAGEMSVNPYALLCLLESKRTSYIRGCKE